MGIVLLRQLEDAVTIFENTDTIYSNFSEHAGSALTFWCSILTEKKVFQAKNCAKL